MQIIARDVKGRVHTLIKGEVALAMDTGANYRDVIFLMFSVLTACAADYAASTITDMRRRWKSKGISSTLVKCSGTASAACTSA